MHEEQWDSLDSIILLRQAIKEEKLWVGLDINPATKLAAHKDFVKRKVFKNKVTKVENPGVVVIRAAKPILNFLNS